MTSSLTLRFVFHYFRALNLNKFCSNHFAEKYLQHEQQKKKTWKHSTIVKDHVPRIFVNTAPYNKEILNQSVYPEYRSVKLLNSLHI